MADRTGEDSSERLERSDAPRLGGEENGSEAEEDRVIAVPLSFEEYEQAELRRKRVHSLVIWPLVALATIGMPVLYLQMTGQFSFINLHPANVAAPKHSPNVTNETYGDMAETKRSPQEQARLDRLKSDLSDYVTHGLSSISSEEKIAVIAVTNVTGPKFKDQATTMAALRADVIPAQEKLVAEAGLLHPGTKEVGELHALLLRAAKMRLLAYRQMLSGGDDPDALWKYAFDAEIKDAETNAEAFHAKLADLAAETGVRQPQ